MESLPINSSFPALGWVEQDPEEIWHAQMRSARIVAQRAGGSISAIGITNQRETTIVWERRTSRPVAPAIVWQCRRTADLCRDLAAGEQGNIITRKTGLVVDAYFSASKLK